MDTSGFTDTFDAYIDEALVWLGDNGEFLFDFMRRMLEGMYKYILWLLELAPFYVVALVLAVLGWRLVNTWFGALVGTALVFCVLMGLWPETMSTLALVITATVLALVVGIPAGVVAGFNPAFDHLLEPVLDLIQPVPPFICVRPCIAVLGCRAVAVIVAT